MGGAAGRLPAGVAAKTAAPDLVGIVAFAPHGPGDSDLDIGRALRTCADRVHPDSAVRLYEGRPMNPNRDRSMTRSSAHRGRRAAAGATALAVAVTGSALVLAPTTGTASSHREAPLTLASPLIDNTDVYAFVSPDKPDTVTLISNWQGFQDPSGGPNFFPWGAEGYRYNIKVDNDGDAVPDQTYRFTFNNIDERTGETFLYTNGPVNSFEDPTLLFKQTYDLNLVDAGGNATLLLDDQPVAPSHVGEASMPDYEALRDEAVTPIGGGGGVAFVGQADDPFFLDIRVFDLLYGGDLSETGNNSLSGFNVNTIALQVPIANLAEGGDDSGIVGAWATTDQQSMSLATGEPSGDFVQVSRLGAPLVNEVVLPIGLKNAFNNLEPVNDASVMAAVNRVRDPEVPKLLEQIYDIPAPAAPRDDLVAAFLTGIEGLNQPPTVKPAEMVRLNTAIAPADGPNRLGVLADDTSGFPNGRRLIDDVVDIELQALAGAIRTGERVDALSAGDGVDSNDLAFAEAFPYVALPHSGSGPSSAGFESGSDSPAGPDVAAASPSATPEQDETEETDVDSAPVSDEDSVGTGVLIGAALIALLIGLGVGLLVARKRDTSTSTRVS
jgi:hypothetical protein